MAQALKKLQEVPSALANSVSPRSKSKKLPKAGNVINRTGGVTTEDGRTLYGMDAETYLRLKAKEDPELERKTGEWIEDVLGRPIEDPSDLWKSLKDGVVLCELLNKIQPGVVKRFATPKNGKALHVLQERENINQYLEACYKLGMSRDALFVTSDLHGRQGMSSVLQNLSALSQKVKYMQATKEGVSGVSSNLAPIAPSKSLTENKSKGKSWNVNTSYLETVMVGDLDDEDVQSKYQELLKEMNTAKLQIKKLEGTNASLKSDLSSYRERIRKLEQGNAAVPVGSANDSRELGTQDSMALGDKSIESLQAEIQQLKAQIAEQEETNKKLRRKDKKQLKEKNNLIDEMVNLQQTKIEGEQGMSEQLSKLIKEANRLEAENKKLKEEININVALLVQKEKESRDQKAKLEKAKTELEETNQTLENDIVTLLAQIDQNVAAENSKVAKLEEENRKLEAQKKVLEEEAKAMNQDINELLADIDNQQLKHTEKLKEEEQKFQSLIQEKAELEKRRNELSEDNSSMYLELKRWEQRLEVVQQQLRDQEKLSVQHLKEVLDSEKEKMSKENQKTLELNQLLEAQLTQLKQKLESSEVSLRDSSKEDSLKIQSLLGNNKRLENEVQHLQAEIATLQKNIKEILEKREGAENDASKQANLRMQQLEDEKERLNQQRLTLESSNMNLKNQIEEFQRSVSRYENQVSHLESEHAKQIASLKNEIQLLNEQYIKSQERVQVLDDDRIQKSKEIQSLKDTLTSQKFDLESQINKLQTEKSSLQNRIETLISEKTGNDTLLQSLQQELKQHTVKIEELEQQDLSKSRRFEAEKKRTETELLRLQTLSESLVAEKQVLQSELEDLRSQNMKLVQNHQTQMKETKLSYEKQIQQDDSKMVWMSEELSNSRITIAELQAEIQELKVARAESDKAKLMAEEIEALKQGNFSLKGELKKTQRGSTQTNSALKKMTQEYAILQQEFMKLKQELAKRSDHEDELEKQVMFLSDVNAQLKEMLKPKPPPNPLFKLLTDLIDTLLDPTKRPNEEDIVKVKPVFKLDEGRRLFTSLLEKAIGATGAKEMSNNNFELLLFLINSCLNELKLENGADYICAKIILQTAESIYRKVKVKSGIKEECIMPFIKDHFVWEHLSFWEEYFWDVMAKSFQDAFGSTADYQEIHKQFIQAKLQEFGKSMEGWGRLKKEDIEKFCKKIEEEVQSEEADSSEETPKKNTEEDSWASESGSSGDDDGLFDDELDSETEDSGSGDNEANQSGDTSDWSGDD